MEGKELIRKSSNKSMEKTRYKISIGLSYLMIATGLFILIYGLLFQLTFPHLRLVDRIIGALLTSVIGSIGIFLGITLLRNMKRNINKRK